MSPRDLQFGVVGIIIYDLRPGTVLPDFSCLHSFKSPRLKITIDWPPAKRQPPVIVQINEFPWSNFVRIVQLKTGHLLHIRIGADSSSWMGH